MIPKFIIKSLKVAVATFLIASVVFIAAEPVLTDAATSSNTTVVTLTVTTGISVTGASTATMSQSLGAATNGAIATTTLTVTTNNSLGYTLAVRATTSPAMQSGANTIADYQTGSPNFWNATSGNAYFGYSAYGTDVSSGTWGAQGSGGCSATSTAHATSTTLKYKGFTTGDVTIATRNSTTTTSGVDATVCYAVEQKNYYIPSGTYNATIIATGTTL
ncbi:MAG: hypothetical protein RL094_223 [Candidatus Parcubacteria bacterium]